MDPQGPPTGVMAGGAQVQVREVDSAVKRLQSSKQTLDDTANVLLERLTPVLSQQPPSEHPTAGCGAAASCPLAGQIEDVATQLDRTIAQLQEALKRLQL